MLTSGAINRVRSVLGSSACGNSERFLTGFNFSPDQEQGREGKMSSDQQKAELDARARRGETVVPGGTGGKSLEAQEHLAEGRSRGGQTRKEQLGTEGYQEMGRKGGLSTGDQSSGERAPKEGIGIDESKFRIRN